MVSADGKIGRTDSNRDESATRRNHEPVGEPARARTYAMRPVNRWKGDYLRVPRRRRAGYLKCAAALAMISPALCAKPLSSTGATAAFDFHERFARFCCSSERRSRFFLRMDDSAIALLDPTSAPRTRSRPDGFLAGPSPLPGGA